MQNETPAEPSSEQKRTWWNHMGEIEGFLSLVISLWIYQKSIESEYLFENRYLLIYGLAISIGFALGAVRFGYSWGKSTGWTILHVNGVFVVLIILELTKPIS